MTTPDAPGPLHTRRVLVTGGLGALGRAVAHTLAARGASVVLLDRAPVDRVHGMVGVLGGVDLGNEADTQAALAEAERLMGGLNALVNVAGGFRWETLAGGSLATWDAMYTVNLRSAVAAIVNVGALAAVKAGAGMAAYAASKAGVARLTEALAEELKDEAVRVNAVLPSILDTPANRTDMPGADASRWVAPAQLAAVVAFLLSDDAAAVTGACIPVAGRV
jgi:NAD(P)-dependent dehydrogenase (short-subunit alcohol dehydrogenase family)